MNPETVTAEIVSPADEPAAGAAEAPIVIADLSPASRWRLVRPAPGADARWERATAPALDITPILSLSRRRQPQRLAAFCAGPDADPAPPAGHPREAELRHCPELRHCMDVRRRLQPGELADLQGIAPRTLVHCMASGPAGREAALDAIWTGARRAAPRPAGDAAWAMLLAIGYRPLPDRSDLGPAAARLLPQPDAA